MIAFLTGKAMTAPGTQNIHSVLKQIENLTLLDMPKTDGDEGSMIEIMSKEYGDEKNPMEELESGVSAISLRSPGQNTETRSERSSSGSSVNFADDELEKSSAEEESRRRQESEVAGVESRHPVLGQRSQQPINPYTTGVPPIYWPDDNDVSGKFMRPDREQVENDESLDIDTFIELIAGSPAINGFTDTRFAGSPEFNGFTETCIAGSPEINGFTDTRIAGSPASSGYTETLIAGSPESSGYQTGGDYFAHTPEAVKDPGSPEGPYEFQPPVTVVNETVSPATSGELPNIDVLKKPLSTEINVLPPEVASELDVRWEVFEKLQEELREEENKKRASIANSRKRPVSHYQPIRPKPPGNAVDLQLPEKQIPVATVMPPPPPRVLHHTPVPIAPMPSSLRNVRPPVVFQVQEPSRSEEQAARMYVAKLQNEHLTQVDLDGDSLLHLFILKGMLAHVGAFLGRFGRHNNLNVDMIINLANNHKQTPVYLATYMNQPSMVAKLIASGADVNLQALANPGRAPLHYSVTQGDSFYQTTAQLLMSPNIKIDAMNGDGKTALHCAIEAHKGLPKNKSGEIITSLESIKCLVLSGASVSQGDGKSGKTPLHYAVECRDPIVVLNLLLSLVPRDQQNINKPNFDGQTCLHIAAGQRLSEHYDHISLINLLLAHGADKTAKNTSKQAPKDLVTRAHAPEIGVLLGSKPGKR